MKYMNTGIREYSQWFRGEDNVVADSLSCDDDWSDEEPTQFFCTHCSSQVPPHFEIQCLPSEITSWLTVLLLKLPVKVQFSKNTQEPVLVVEQMDRVLRMDRTLRPIP
jgi:hypothetical protein